MVALEMKFHLESTPEEAFRALTEPGQVAAWWGPKAAVEAELRVGGRYRWGMELPNGVKLAAVGQYTEIAPPERLGFTFTWEGEEESFQSSVSMTLASAGTGAELGLLQTGFADEQSRDNHIQGWGDCLGRLQAFLKQGRSK